MAKRLIYQVAVGPKRELWETCIESIAGYAAAHGVEHRVQREPILRIAPRRSQRSEGAMRLGYLPILEKFNAWSLLAHYDEIAVIDADVYARRGAPLIFDEAPVGAVFCAAVERRMPIVPAYAAKLDQYARGQYGDPSYPFRNCGVLVLRRELRDWMRGQDALEFVRRREFEPYIDGVGPYRWSTDQTLLNWWLRLEGVPAGDLSWKWNALYGMLEPWAIEQAHFVHFLLSDHLSSNDPDTLLRGGSGRRSI